MLRPMVQGLEAISRATGENQTVLHRIDKTAMEAAEAQRSVPQLITSLEALLEQRNGVSQRMFDALHEAEGPVVLRTDRVEEFAPIKNATGVDSPATSHQLQSDRAGRWLARHGVPLPQTPDGRVDARIEISPLTALDPDDLAGVRLPRGVSRGGELVL